MKKMMPSEVYARFKAQSARSPSATKAGEIDADKGVDNFSEKLQEERER